MDGSNVCMCGKLSTEVVSSDETDEQLQIECDICHTWFHARCVKLGRIGVQSVDKYHCPRCESMCGSSVMKAKTNEHRHNPTEENADDKPPQVGTKVFNQNLVDRNFFDATDPGGIAEVVHSGRELTLPYLSTSGFSRPILIPEADGLGLTAPDSDFGISDVPSSVGEEKSIDVIDVQSQESLVMTVKEFCDAFQVPLEKRQATLNCLSLEVSELPLGDEVMPPLVARMLCWVTNVWPQSIQDRWENGEPPQVQKYCIMSMEGSYTDFHIDFGGTSVWYHIFKGEKVFYFIQPTSNNLSLYERWQRMSGQSETFLGDMVDKCYKLVAKEGQTVFIPTGWIHAVYTPCDSLVFGGNFLHSLNIQLQLKVYDIEERIKTPRKFRFPQFEAVNWLAAQKLKNDLSDLNSDSTLCPSHLLSGIKALLQALKSWLPALETKTCPPSIDPHKLVRELAKELRLAEKVTLKCNPLKPERESKRKKQKKGLDEDFIDISKGNAFLFLGRVSKKKPTAAKNESNKKTASASQNAIKSNQQPSTKDQQKKPAAIKIVPKKRKIDLEQLENTKQEEEEDENFTLSFPAKRSQSPKHIKLKLPMSALSAQPYDLTDRDSVRQLLSSQKQHMKQLDTALGDALADFHHGNDEDLVIDEKPIKLKLSLGAAATAGSAVAAKRSPVKKPLKTVIRQTVRSKANEDMNMTKVHQDDDYVYPSLELSDDEMDVGPSVTVAKDDAWTPKVKVRGTLTGKMERAPRDKSKKVAAVEAGLKQASEKRRKLNSSLKKKQMPIIPSLPTAPIIKAPSIQSESRSSLLMNTPSSSSTLEAMKLSLSRAAAEDTANSSSKKPKKGLSTAKQRLGKILKLKF